MFDRCKSSCGNCDGSKEPTPASCGHVHTNRAIFGEADAGGSGSQSWTLDQCKDACKASKVCVLATYAEKATQYTQAGYCELWSTSHTASELQGLAGFNTYVCTQATLGVSPTATNPNEDITKNEGQCTMKPTCSNKPAALNRGRRPRLPEQVFHTSVDLTAGVKSHRV
jgi:hypothetical protein